MSVNQTKNYRIVSHFSSCEEPRKCRIQHPLIDIIVIVVLATLCGEEGWEGFHDWGKDKTTFLKEFLRLPRGIPSPDTLRRVVERLNPEKFFEAFLSWAEEIEQRSPGQICIDGKTLKKAATPEGVLHVVAAFATENGIILGSKDADGKGKEIPTIKNLLDSLALKVGDIVTIDAIGCQKEIVGQIKKQKADYLIALKKNQGNLWSEAYNFFEQAIAAEAEAPVTTIVRKSQRSSRKDNQKIWVTTELSWLERKTEWEGLSALICVQREWENSGEKKEETRYYISSAKKSAEEFSEVIRRHWAIENEYHWHLDVTFNEDDSIIQARSNRILRVARTIALQLLKAETTKGMSIIRKKRKCHRSEGFLKKVLLAGNF